MKKISMPRFRIVLSLVIMIPSFSFFLGTFLVILNTEYIYWMNGDAFRPFVVANPMDFILLFCFMAFVASAILLLTTVYTLDKEREKDQQRSDG